MRTQSTPRGVFVPACTPFRGDLSVDSERFLAHCRWLIDEGANGLAVFGTTSEANSLSGGERMEALEHLIDSDISPAVLMPGTGCCALPDTVALTRHAVDLDCMGVLLLPPFYYKGVSDDGLYAGISELIQRVGDRRLRIYLYHIPPMAGVGFALALIERLLKDFPGIVVGIKDSSGDWNNTQAMLKAFPEFEIFPGSETFLLGGLRLGGAGCISATANINVSAMRALIDSWTTPAADAMQRQLSALRATVQKFPLVPANKAILGRLQRTDDWNTVRPPLATLSNDAKAQLFAALEALRFDLETSAVAA
ncbi:MAG: dihydrodipicolinate synthase family protein [Burkholderiaceae bacterium]